METRKDKNKNKIEKRDALSIGNSTSLSSMTTYLPISSTSSSHRIRRASTLDEVHSQVLSDLQVQTNESFLELDKHLDITKNINPSNTATVTGLMKFNRNYPAAVHIKANGKCFLPNNSEPMVGFRNYAIVEVATSKVHAHLDAQAHFYLTIDRESYKQVLGEYGVKNLLANLDDTSKTKFKNDLIAFNDFKQLSTSDADFVYNRLINFMHDPNAAPLQDVDINAILATVPNLYKLFKYSLDDYKKIDFRKVRTYPVFAAGTIYFDSEGYVIQIGPQSGYAHATPTSDKDHMAALNDSQHRARNLFELFRRHEHVLVTFKQGEAIDKKIFKEKEIAKANHHEMTDAESYDLRRRLVRYTLNFTIFQNLSVNKIEVPSSLPPSPLTPTRNKKHNQPKDGSPRRKSLDIVSLFTSDHFQRTVEGTDDEGKKLVKPSSFDDPRR